MRDASPIATAISTASGQPEPEPTACIADGSDACTTCCCLHLRSRLWQMVKEFDEVVFGEEPGAVYGPVRSSFGHHLIFLHSCRTPPN